VVRSRPVCTAVKIFCAERLSRFCFLGDAYLPACGKDARPENASQSNGEAEEVRPARSQEGLQESAERTKRQHMDAEASKPLLRPPSAQPMSSA
jgi:hypothetical protein